MSTFEIAQVPRITAGAGARAQVGRIGIELAGKGANVLLVADPGLKASGAIDDVRALLKKAGFNVIGFTNFSSDPTIAKTDAAADLARAKQAHLVVALGGGSALDLAKSVAGIAGARKSALHYELCQEPFPKKRLKMIAVPTTSGTGSETTRTAILTRADKAKTWLWDNNLKFDEIVLDPELTVSLPAHLTAATGLDALVHAIEAATNRNSSAAKNFHAYEAIRLAAHHLETAVKEPANLEARLGMQMAAALAGVAIDNGGTAIAHNIGHAMGSLRPVHHGRAVGLAMLASLAWNIRDDDGRYAACAKAMGLKPKAAALLEGFERLLRATGVKVSLAEDFAGVAPEILAMQMMRPENASMREVNWRTSTDEDLLMIAKATLALA